MSIKRILCLTLCFALLLCCSACKNVDTFTSSDCINTSSIKDNTSSTESALTIDKLEKEYGFSSIKDVKYYCVKNVPESDAIYTITQIINNHDNNVCDYTFDVLCENKDVKIDDKTITIPYSYLQKNNSIELTVIHYLSNITYNFTLKLENEWTLLFEDNFDGTELNTEVWNVWDEERDWRYSYSKDNMLLDSQGNLVNRMSVLKEPDAATGETRTTGTITTKDKFETTYGYFEIRMKPHQAAGLMGAFWLMCGDMGDKDAADDGTAVNGCEIDIVETFYHTKNPSHTIHWDGYTHTKSQGFNNQGRDDIFDGNFHTFAFLWTPEEYVFFIDNEITARTNEIDICNQPGYILISSHFNSNAGELPIGVGEHTDMIVDYVKVYKNKNY